MSRPLSDKGRKALCLLFALVLASFFSACAMRLPGVSKPSEAYGEMREIRTSSFENELWAMAVNHAETTHDEKQAFSLDKALSLMPPARELAALRLERDSSIEAERYLEAVLKQAGIAARPATALWLKGDKSADLKRAGEKWLGDFFRFLSENRYNEAGIGLAFNEEGQWALAAVGLHRTMQFEAPVPKRIELGEEVLLKGKVSDDVGVIYLVVKSPNGMIREEGVPFYAGRFELRLKLNQKGIYDFEMKCPIIEGGQQNLMRFQISVGEKPKAQTPSPVKFADITAYPKSSKSIINVLRTKSGRRVLTSFPEVDNRLAAWVRDYKDTPASAPQTERKIALKGLDSVQCIFLTAYTKAPESLLAENLTRPSWLKLALDAKLIAYSGYGVQSSEGYLVGDAFCRPKEPERSLLIAFNHPPDRRRYIDFKAKLLAKQMGLEFIETEKESYTRWVVVQASEALTDMGGLPRLLVQPQFAEEASPVSDEERFFVDELFTSLYQAAWELRDTFKAEDPRRGAVGLLLLQALLMQGRVEAARAEIERMEDFNPENSIWLQARQELASGWLEAYRGDIEDSMESLIQAVKRYKEIQLKRAMQTIAFEVILIYRASMRSEESKNLPLPKLPEKAP